jgi:hypothetical protein
MRPPRIAIRAVVALPIMTEVPTHFLLLEHHLGDGYFNSLFTFIRAVDIPFEALLR